MQYPHWLMVAGAVLVAMGIFGFAFARKRNVEHDHESNEATGTMMQPPLGLIFTIDVNSKPTVAFEARQLREAAELSKQEWLRADLNTLSSNGAPLCGIGSKLSARIANEPEREIYRKAVKEAKPSDDVVFAYLVEVDEAQ